MISEYLLIHIIGMILLSIMVKATDDDDVFTGIVIVFWSVVLSAIIAVVWLYLIYCVAKFYWWMSGKIDKYSLLPETTW